MGGSVKLGSGRARQATIPWELHGRGTSQVLLASIIVLASGTARGEDTPQQWEQLFFPFPIAGAPPQLEQQVQVFASVFNGRQGVGLVPAVEIGIIASPHLGFVATVPFQFGFSGQATGLQDSQFLAQYLLAGSLALDDMVSIGAAVTVPTAMNGLGGGDLFLGPFVYAARRFWHRFIIEANLTGTVPVVRGESARQVAVDGLLSILLTPLHFSVPIYVQVEADSTTYLNGTAALPPLATKTPVEVLAIAPEVFFGPFASPISSGTRIAAGVFFNVQGDPVHAVTGSLTAAFDIPNRYGY